MVIAAVNIIPIGTNSPTVGEFIAEAIKVLEEEGIEYEVGAMSTIIEGEMDHVLDVIKKMHETPFRKGIKRVVTTVTIDDRRDKLASSKNKIRAVKRQLGDRFINKSSVK